MEKKYDIWDIPEDTGKGNKSPIAQAIIDLRNDTELSLEEKFKTAITMATALNIQLRDYKKRALHAEKRYNVYCTEKRESILALRKISYIVRQFENID